MRERAIERERDRPRARGRTRERERKREREGERERRTARARERRASERESEWGGREVSVFWVQEPHLERGGRDRCRQDHDDSLFCTI